MKKNFFDVADAGKMFLWCLILPQILAFVFQLILTGVGAEIGKTFEELLELTPIYLAYTMISQIAFLIVLLIFSRQNKFKESIKLNNKFGLTNTIICVVIGIIGLFALSPISNVFVEILNSIGYNTGTGLLLDLSSPLMLIICIILIAGVPAVIEEFVFRGVILQGLRKYGNLVAILATSGLFALVHLSAQQVIYPFIFSLILCYTVIKTNSIWASMIIHFVANATSILMSYFSLTFDLNVSFFVYVLIALGSVAVGFAVVWLLSRLLKNTEKERTAMEVMQDIGFKEQMPKFNSSTNDLKLGLWIGGILWVLSFISGFVV